MNYKKLIKNKDTRLAILRALSFIPDRPMLKLQYRLHMGRKLDLKNPKRYTEKLQWYKLYYRNPQMAACVDKYEVRKYVEQKGYGHILNECYGVYESVDAIDFSLLPESFVLKDTLGGGGDSVIIIRDKAKADLDSVKEKLQQWLDRPGNIPEAGREWPYYANVKHRIIIEKFLDTGDKEISDYKFRCFGGRVDNLQILTGRSRVNSPLLEACLDRDFKPLPHLVREHIKIENPEDYRPACFDEMIKAAEDISRDFPHVRMDLYAVNDKPVFGEMTFFAASGYMKFYNDNADFILGDLFVLPEKIK